MSVMNGSDSRQMTPGLHVLYELILSTFRYRELIWGRCHEGAETPL